MTSSHPPAQDPRERIVEALYRIVQSIQTSGDLPALLQTIMLEGKHLLDSDASSLFLFDSERNDLYFEVVVGGDEQIRAIRVPLGQGIVGASAAKRETVMVNDVAADSRHFKMGGGEGGFVTRNLIAAPMLRNDRLIGVLEVLNKHGNADYDAMDVKVLEILAEQAAVQIENARLIRDKLKSERLAALGTTAAGLAHYIKNVLSHWKGSASLIDIGLKTGNNSLIGETWPILKRANEKITKLVQDMLAISKDREPERQPLSINKLVMETVEECSQRASASGIGLTMKLDEAMPVASLDPTRMHDVVLNLLGNAIEAIEESATPNAKIEAATEFDPAKKLLRIRIADTGPGMTPEVKTRVMEPFFSTKGSRGTGLGLSVALKTVEEHDGKLTLDSEVGKGTTFTIELPHVRSA